MELIIIVTALCVLAAIAGAVMHHKAALVAIYFRIKPKYRWMAKLYIPVLSGLFIVYFLFSSMVLMALFNSPSVSFIKENYPEIDLGDVLSYFSITLLIISFMYNNAFSQSKSSLEEAKSLLEEVHYCLKPQGTNDLPNDSISAWLAAARALISIKRIEKFMFFSRHRMMYSDFKHLYISKVSDIFRSSKSLSILDEKKADNFFSDNLYGVNGIYCFDSDKKQPIHSSAVKVIANWIGEFSEEFNKGLRESHLEESDLRSIFIAFGYVGEDEFKARLWKMERRPVAASDELFWLISYNNRKPKAEEIE